MKNTFLLLMLITTEFTFGQKFKIVVEDEMFQKEKADIHVYLILENDTLLVNQGYNDFGHVEPEKYRSILVILNQDSLNFREVIDYGNEQINNVMKLFKPNFKFIQQNNWTLIIDKTPVKNKRIKKVIQKAIKKGTRIIAFKSDKIEWVIMDKTYF